MCFILLEISGFAYDLVKFIYLSLHYIFIGGQLQGTLNGSLDQESFENTQILMTM